MAIKSYYDGGGRGGSDPFISGRGGFLGVGRNSRWSVHEPGILREIGGKPGGLLADWAIFGPGRIDTPTPVGLGGPGIAGPGVITDSGVPPVVSSTPSATPTGVPPAIDRRDKPSVAPPIQGVGMRIARDWFEYHELNNAGIPVSPPQPGSRAQTPVVIPKSVEEPTMDLGATLGGLLQTAGTAYINQRFGGPQYAQAPVQATPADLGSLLGQGPDLLPGMDIVGQSPGKDYAWKYRGCEKGWGWVKIRRRRCKNLITPSQLGQLQSIIAICGKNSELTKTIVAKGGVC